MSQLIFVCNCSNQIQLGISYRRPAFNGWLSDISSDQFPEALKGVHASDATIHSASPIAEKADTKEMLNASPQKSGIRRIVTSSIATVTTPKNSFSYQGTCPDEVILPILIFFNLDRNLVTRKDALEQSAFIAYIASKALAEKALWESADAHPNVDATTRPFPGSIRYNNVQNIAKVHVLALKSPISSASKIGRKRLVISSLDPFDYAQSWALIREKRPELAKKLTRVALPNLDKSTLVVPFDAQRVEDVVSFKKENYTGIESTFLDAIDSILAIDSSWVKQGHKINIPEI
ncbi:hypothetical protein C8J56DRAFT_1034549 [Mycena floridula]|nr:hypothetical protein C8J56DRAFT_1034549 [Mycena floridula]